MPSPSPPLLRLVIEALGYHEPGLVEIVKRILEAQSLKFTHLAHNGVGVEVSADGRRVTNTSYDHVVCMPKPMHAVMTPGVCRCWCIKVHRASQSGVALGAVAIGVVGTTDQGDDWHGVCTDATFHGWCGMGRAWVAGQPLIGHGGWPYSGWVAGDEAALRLDAAAGKLTLKHARLGRAFALAGLQLPNSVRQWFVHVNLFDRGDSVEVQPMTMDQFGAFLA